MSMFCSGELNNATVKVGKIKKLYIEEEGQLTFPFHLTDDIVAVFG